MYTVDQITQQIYAIAKSWALSDLCAHSLVTSLTHAEITGYPGHGLRLLGIYQEKIQKGSINVQPLMSTDYIAHNHCILDADQSIGARAADEASDLSVDMAKTHGSSMVFVKNSNHFGRSACWSEKIAQHDLVSLIFSNSPRSRISAPGHTKAVFGNNLLSFAAGEFSFDMGCAVMSTGNLTNSLGEDARNQTLDPMAAHKGIGLSMMIEIITAILIGKCANLPDSVNRNVSHLFLTVDPVIINPDFFGSLERYLDEIKRLEIRVPGEMSRQRAESCKEIEISDSTISMIFNLCQLNETAFLLDK